MAAEVFELATGKKKPRRAKKATRKPVTVNEERRLKARLAAVKIEEAIADYLRVVALLQQESIASRIPYEQADRIARNADWERDFLERGLYFREG